MRFLVWSNQRRMWWRDNRRGYTDMIEEAGRYERSVAESIVDDASVGGQLVERRKDPITGRWYSQLPEVMVLAPEDTPAAPEAELIIGHSWRPPKDSHRSDPAQPCAYMNCRRPRGEHERAVRPSHDPVGRTS